MDEYGRTVYVTDSAMYPASSSKQNVRFSSHLKRVFGILVVESRRRSLGSRVSQVPPSGDDGVLGEEEVAAHDGAMDALLHILEDLVVSSSHFLRVLVDHHICNMPFVGSRDQINRSF